MKMTFTPGPGVRVISHSEGVVINQPSIPANVTIAINNHSPTARDDSVVAGGGEIVARSIVQRQPQ